MYYKGDVNTKHESKPLTETALRTRRITKQMGQTKEIDMQNLVLSIRGLSTLGSGGFNTLRDPR